MSITIYLFIHFCQYCETWRARAYNPSLHDLGFLQWLSPSQPIHWIKWHCVGLPGLFVINTRIRCVEQWNAVSVPFLPKFLHDVYLGLYLTSAVACRAL